jgi:hypothetical protein
LKDGSVEKITRYPQKERHDQEDGRASNRSRFGVTWPTVKKLMTQSITPSALQRSRKWANNVDVDKPLLSSSTRVLSNRSTL